MPRATRRLAVRNQPMPPTAAPVASAPSFLPIVRLRMPPMIGTKMNRKMAIDWKSKPPNGESRRGPP